MKDVSKVRSTMIMIMICELTEFYFFRLWNDHFNSSEQIINDQIL